MPENPDPKREAQKLQNLLSVWEKNALSACPLEMRMEFERIRKEFCNEKGVDSAKPPYAIAYQLALRFGGQLQEAARKRAKEGTSTILRQIEDNVDLDDLIRKVKEFYDVYRFDDEEREMYGLRLGTALNDETLMKNVGEVFSGIPPGEQFGITDEIKSKLGGTIPGLQRFIDDEYRRLPEYNLEREKKERAARATQLVHFVRVACDPYRNISDKNMKEAFAKSLRGFIGDEDYKWMASLGQSKPTLDSAMAERVLSWTDNDQFYAFLMAALKNVGAPYHSQGFREGKSAGKADASREYATQLEGSQDLIRQLREEKQGLRGDLVKQTEEVNKLIDENVTLERACDGLNSEIVDLKKRVEAGSGSKSQELEDTRKRHKDAETRLEHTVEEMQDQLAENSNGLFIILKNLQNFYRRDKTPEEVLSYEDRLTDVVRDGRLVKTLQEYQGLVSPGIKLEIENDVGMLLLNSWAPLYEFVQNEIANLAHQYGTLSHNILKDENEKLRSESDTAKQQLAKKDEEVADRQRWYDQECAKYKEELRRRNVLEQTVRGKDVEIDKRERLISAYKSFVKIMKRSGGREQ